jgi:hypothetical protein
MKVRRLIGDVNSSNALLDDDEIYSIFSTTTIPTYAAACAAEMLVAEFALQVDTKNGQLEVRAAERMNHYMKLADRLRAGGAGELPFGGGDGILPRPYAGGVFVSEKDELEDNDDLDQPHVTLGVHDIEQQNSDDED